MEVKEMREEILKRAGDYRRAEQKRALLALRSAAALLLVILCGSMVLLPEGSPDLVGSGNYGTLAFGSELGGYVLIGILCFVLGMVITLIAVKRRDLEKEDKTEKRE